MDKNQLKSEIEKAIHKFVDVRIKEHVRDFTVLYIRRNPAQFGDVDRESMAKVLDVVQLAVTDAYFKSIDAIMTDLDKSLQEFAEESHPLPSTSEAEQ